MTTTLERPAESAGELYYPTPVTPEEAFQAIGRLRKEARDAIDQLIQFLDKTDDYVSRELEDEADAGPCDTDELEGDDTPGGQSADDEPSLGSGATGELSTQAAWASQGRGSALDLEDEHDGAEDDAEGDSNENDEPSLGWGLNGEGGNTSGADRELQEHAPVKPQGRTDLGKGVRAADRSYRRGVLGLTATQAVLLRERERADTVRRH